MWTLFSPGRTNFRVPDSEFDLRYDGHTYAVPNSDFAFLAELLPTDMDSIMIERQRAQQTHQLDQAGRIFTPND